METTTIISIFFVAILAIVGLRFVFGAFYRPYVLFRLETIARRSASKLWFEAYDAEDQETRENLFDVSKKIDAYATTIRENRIIPQDFNWCADKIKELNADADLEKSIEDFLALPKEKQLVVVGNILMVFLIVFALAVRFPLTLGLFFLNISLVIFLMLQWDKVSMYFAYSFIESGDAALQSMPT